MQFTPKIRNRTLSTLFIFFKGGTGAALTILEFISKEKGGIVVQSGKQKLL